MVPVPARAVIPSSGVTTGAEGITAADPPAAVSGFFAASPMTAIDRTLPAGQRQRTVGVLEQDGALLGDPFGQRLVLRGADVGVLDGDGVGGRVVEQPDAEHRGEDVGDHAVELGGRDGTGLHGGLELGC